MFCEEPVGFGCAPETDDFDLRGPLVVACFAGEPGNRIACVALTAGPDSEAPTRSTKVAVRARTGLW